jgi:hypothetical protein
MQAVNPLVDLTAILAILASAAATVRIAYLLMRGRRMQARRVLTRSAFVAAGYVVVSLGASAVRPERSISLGERWCFDEWCVSVDGVTHHDASGGTVYTLDLQTYNAGRRPQRALYPWMFLRDDNGRQFQPTTKDWVNSVEASVAPHGSNRFPIDFLVPGDAGKLGFSTNHGSGAPCNFLAAVVFIGQGGCLFNKYDSIRLQ